ncbi:hypothetical protein CHL78_012895 [Romboutsia weinsteinii]|uniref:DUF2178 domain-containing protein n=1 Tax=Romboutsia weinsteinii TaxID=2020949 RepID=A0A371J1F7_9FIRM|nr:hypothetical protein [Romboutsia weinsteinii]RDY26545.1 hypothetical protein CHL78_012895 [Romboutsia weinsteinii]
MLDKKKSLIIMLLGIVLAIVGLLSTIFVDGGDMISRLSTLVFALGFGLIGGALGSLYKIKRIEKIPGKSKQMEIEYKDERNELIRDKASAKAGDISNWLVLLIAYICIVMGYPIWLIFLILGVFLAKYIIWIVLMNKYNKEL